MLIGITPTETRQQPASSPLVNNASTTCIDYYQPELYFALLVTFCCNPLLDCGFLSFCHENTMSNIIDGTTTATVDIVEYDETDGNTYGIGALR